MKLSKSMLAAGVVTTIAAASVFTLGNASAQTNTSGDSLVDRIATTFGLNRDEVQTVFDEQRAEMQASREEQHAEHLNELVEAGTITAEQKTALEAKHAEMQTAREALKNEDLTHEEKHEKMETARAEFEAWAEGMGIDLEAIRPAGGMGHGHGPRGGFGTPDQQ